jgi:two-component system CheB/CheR fusion protein
LYCGGVAFCHARAGRAARARPKARQLAYHEPTFIFSTFRRQTPLGALAQAGVYMNDTLESLASAAAHFPIVGIGASSGGLEAILELLAELPAQAGLAVLVVQHLDPARPSMLSEIFANHTALQVFEARDEALIEPNCLYVIPPNVRMAVEFDRLKLSPRAPLLGPAMPIDDLFLSMAHSAADRAIGVVLSGSGTDGARGLQAIKAHGGITFAQDDASARFSSMPRAAVELGSVDFVLAPPLIAAQLLRLARHPQDPAAQPGEETGAVREQAYARLFAQLYSNCNIDFSHYKRGTIERRLSRRMLMHDLYSLHAYLALLESDPAEARALCKEFLINFTHFFRDPETFKALTQTAFPRLLADRESQAPLRVWVPGCSTGEEVYSIAICLHEYLLNVGSLRPVQIFGTDISEEALELARTGKYLENITRHVSPERLQACFTKEGAYYRVNKALRDYCIFARQNVAYDPPFSRLDFISCRNLLIYLEPRLQKRVMPLFHFSLQPQGVLLLGVSETIGAYSELFTPLADTHSSKLFGKKALPGLSYSHLVHPPAATAKPRSPLVTRHDTAHGARAGLQEKMRREMDAMTLARFAPASVSCDENFQILEFRGDTSAFLTNPKGAPTTDLCRMARPGVLFAISEAIREVRETDNPVATSGLSVGQGAQQRDFSLEVVPLHLPQAQSKHFAVFFHQAKPALATVPARRSFWRFMTESVVLWSQRQSMQQQTLLQLRTITSLSDELRATREHVSRIAEEQERALEEYRSAEEETLSSNEEFQSANEELETAKEELQSLNEELSTTNDELRYRNGELKGLHEEVSRSRDYGDAIVNTMGEPMLVLDSNFRIERANRAFYEFFQTLPRETLHINLFALGNGQWDIPVLRDLLEEMLPHRTEVRDHEVTAYFPKLGRRTMRLNATRLVWPEHQALILLNIDDVTARHLVLERLMHGDRQKDEFLAMLAHELRNPLASMRNALELLRHPQATAETQKKAQLMLDRQLHKQIRLVDELLDVSRISRGIVALQVARFDLVMAIRTAVEALNTEINDAAHTVVLDLPSEGLMVEGDAARFEQVVTNLLVNAIKYTPRNGKIDVSLRREFDEAVLSISDNGIGMSAEFLTRVFTVFAQEDNSFDKTNGGLGIGLALVRRIAELHGGSVRANSRGLNQGSSFVLRVPAPFSTVSNSLAGAAVDAAGLGRTHAPAHTAASVTAPLRRRVLIVDDNHDAAESLAIVLGLDGHEVCVSFDAAASFTAVEAFKPEVVLLDLGLPNVDGYEICKRMRDMPAHRAMTIIAISGYGDARSVEAARSAGFDNHMTKPADLRLLAQYLQAEPS